MLLSWAMVGTGWRAFGYQGKRSWRGWLVFVMWGLLATGGGSLCAQSSFPVPIPNFDFSDPANEGTTPIPPSVLVYEDFIGTGPWIGWGQAVPHPETTIANGRATVSGMGSLSDWAGYGPGTYIHSAGGFRQYGVTTMYGGWTFLLTTRVSAEELVTEAALEELGVFGSINLSALHMTGETVSIFNGGEYAILERTYVVPPLTMGTPLSIRLVAGEKPPSLDPLPYEMLGDVHFEEVSLIATPAPPLLQCPSTLYLTTDAGCMAVVPSVTVPVVPGTSPFTNYTYDQVPAAGSLLPVGKGWITVTVTDPYGHSSVCSIPVMVIDTTPPVVSCVPPLTVDTCTGAIPDITGLVWAEDNCTPTEELQITQTPPAGTPVGPGTHLIQVAVTDSAFNTGFCLTTYTVTPSQATDPIVLHNTGMDAPGVPATGGGSDAHYVMIQSPDPIYPGPTAHVIDPVPAMWMPNSVSPDSRWISASRDDLYIPVAGTYVFRQEFTLPQGFTVATISGQWMSDNAAEIHLNGVPTGQTTPAGGFTAWTPFLLQSGFVEGVNTLDFVVESFPVFGPNSYSGVRVEMSGQVTYCDNPCIAPYIVSQPVSTHGIHFPGEAIFSVTAGGAPPLSYQWYYNGVPISGATGPELIAAPSTVYLPGSYYVVVTNGCGQVVSQVANRRSPFATVQVAHWLGGSFVALARQPGGSLTYLDAGARDYNRTEFLTRFGPSDTFGIPGLHGLPLPVMRVRRNTPAMGYMFEAEVVPGGSRHSFAVDVLIPPEQADQPIPFLQADTGNTDAADLYLYATEGDAPEIDRTAILPVNEWVRVVAVVDPDYDENQVLFEWFVNGQAQGSTTVEPVRWMAPEGIRRFSHDSDPPEPDPESVPMRVLLFTDFSEIDFHLYVSQIVWWNRTLADFEVHALGSPGRSAMHLRDLSEPSPQLTVERIDPTDPDEGDSVTLRYRWFGEGARLQQSTDLRTWVPWPDFPAMEFIDGRMRNEIDVIMETAPDLSFEDMDTSGSGRGTGLYMRLRMELP